MPISWNSPLEKSTRPKEFHASTSATEPPNCQLTPSELVHEFVPTPLLDRPAPETTRGAAEELAELVGDARTLTDRDLRLLALLLDGASMTEVATTLDVCVRTVTNHRDAVVHRLRQVAADMAVA